MTTTETKQRIRLAGWYMQSASDAGRFEKELYGRFSDLNRQTWKWFDFWRMSRGRELAAAAREAASVD